jgi:hypothetical protein
MIIIMKGIMFYLERKMKNYRSPFSENALRSPGQSLFFSLNEKKAQCQYDLIMFMVSPCIVYSLHISQSYFAGEKETAMRISLSFFLGFVIFYIFGARLVKSIKQAKKLRLGYYGELATGQCLQQLVRGGYHVFHDFPAEKFNIDHIAVGTGGVFAIETKARSKPVLKNGNGRDEAKVIYDGNKLKFPTWEETEPLVQAERQAKWLADFLTKAVGEPVKVQPILSLPGWYVERTARHGMLVVNPKNLSFLLKSKDLSESMINRIAHQLEQKCRDVEPGEK